MKTLAVMCMALTRHNPSCTPLFRTRAATVPVMFTKPRRPGTSNQSCSVSDFIAAKKSGGRAAGRAVAALEEFLEKGNHGDHADDDEFLEGEDGDPQALKQAEFGARGERAASHERGDAVCGHFIHLGDAGRIAAAFLEIEHGDDFRRLSVDLCALLDACDCVQLQ